MISVDPAHSRRSYWHDSFTCDVTHLWMCDMWQNRRVISCWFWYVSNRGMTLSYGSGETWVSSYWDTFGLLILGEHSDMTLSRVTWLIYKCVTCGSKETKLVNIVTCLIYVWCVSILWQTRSYMTYLMDMRDMTHLYVTCRINMCDTIYMWCDSIICVTCGSGETKFYVCQHCGMTHWYVTCRVDMGDMWQRRNEVSQRCAALRPLILGNHSDMALSNVWRDSFMNMWRDSFMFVPWLVHMCDMWTDSYVWLIHMCDMCQRRDEVSQRWATT